jgi:preprotein translocase subunit SecG
METLKKYWWLLLVLPIVAYFVYAYISAKTEKDDQLAKAREAKAVKKLVKEVEAETNTETETILNNAQSN